MPFIVSTPSDRIRSMPRRPVRWRTDDRSTNSHCPMPMLHAGDQAPDFTATLDDGTSFTLSEQRGKVIVLFFYPKDDTPG